MNNKNDGTVEEGEVGPDDGGWGRACAGVIMWSGQTDDDR